MYLIYDTLGSDMPIMGLELMQNYHLLNTDNVHITKQFIKILTGVL